MQEVTGSSPVPPTTIEVANLAPPIPLRVHGEYFPYLASNVLQLAHKFLMVRLYDT